MATDNAGAPGFGLGIADWNPPFSETLNLVGNKPQLAGSMGIMAGLARPALVLFVHMHEMNIGDAIPETGLGIGDLVIRNLGVMATKAQVEVPFIKGQVELLGKVALQQMGICGPVRCVAGIAFTAGNRAMYRFSGEKALFMTAQTEVLALPPQHVFHICLMRIVAAGTISVSNGCMGKFAVELRLVVA